MKSNQNNIIKIIALFLVMALIACVFISCGEKNTDTSRENDNDDKAENPNSDQNDEENAEEVKLLPDLPDVNYDGYTFTFLAHKEGASGWDWVGDEARELVAEMQDGQEVQNSEPINDAVYQRNSVIKSRYGIEIKMVSDTGENSTLKKIVNAGDDTYDAVLIFNNNVPGVVTGNLLMEVSQLPYIDLDKPWWDDGVNAMSVVNKQYLLAGDLLILDNEATNAMIFNKDLMADLGMDLPYQSVKDGKWTFDKMIEMTKDVELDLNGDGKLDYPDDRFSMMVFNDTLQAMLIAGGGLLADKDPDDVPYMCFAEPRNLQVLEKAMDLMYTNSNPGVFNVQSVGAGTGNVTWMKVYYDTFMEDRVLFMWIRMRVVEAFRGMDSNFGILPMPKYDEAQDNYCSLVNPYTGVMLGVPKTTGDPERTSIILEALSAESKYTLQPAYYDIVLNRKFARDEESSEMLDIIFNTQVYDIGGVYSFGSVFSDFCNLAGKQDRNVISYYDKKIGSMEKAIDKVVTQFEALDD
ncbi:MAG: extracellular solute-binding protein [Oscillospiraceae bacterium]|nr:extracellular solute-binding protein [Oscillospiraceae bacterium]